MKKTLLATLAMTAAIAAQAAVQLELLTNGAGTTLEGWESENFEIDPDDGFSPNNTLITCTMEQTVTFADLGITADDIAASEGVTATGWFRIRYSGDTAEIKVYQLNEAGQELETNSILRETNCSTADDGSTYQVSFSLNSGTRKLRYRMYSQGDSNFFLGPRFKNCSLILTTVMRRTATFVSAGTTVGTVEYCVGETVPEAPVVSRDNCRFLGYFTAETGGEKVYNENLEFVLPNNSEWKLTGNVTLYAQWKLETVNFTFSSGGVDIGTVTYQTSSATGTEAPIALKRNDDKFLGYFTEQTGGVKVYDENYEFVLADTSILTDPNTTLYAQWKVVPRKLEGGITRLVYRGVLSNFGEWTSGLKKDMTVKVYESASAAIPLWSGDVADVPINPDGSFEAVFGNDDLALAFASNNLTHVELTVGESLSPLAPRRAFASIASVNRALVAEGAARDIKVGTLGANSIVAEKITAGALEASGTVRVEGSVSVEVKPFDIKPGQETTIWRGEGGVSAWGDSVRVATANDVVAGQLLWTSDREGVAMIHATGKTRSTLRIPATIQFVRPGDEVRAPTWENGEVSVTFWGYRK